jgi:integrase
LAGLLENFAKKLPVKLLFKEAKINSKGGNLSATWYVSYSYRINIESQFVRYRITGNINRIADYQTRMEAAITLQQVINQALASGWNPTDESDYEGIQENTNIIDTIKQVIKSKTGNVRKITITTYTTQANRFFSFLKAKGLDNINAGELKPLHVHKFVKYMQNCNLNNVTINTTIETMYTLFNRLHRLKVVPDNPFTVHDRMKEEESEYYTTFTPDELQLIFNRLREQFPGLYLFSLLIYYCYMRPASIVQLKVSDFDMEARKIVVPGKHHKNRKTAEKQILQPLYEALIKSGYLTSINAGIKYDKRRAAAPVKLPVQPGATGDNTGKGLGVAITGKTAGKDQQDYFLFSKFLQPGNTPAKANAAARYWKDLVMDKWGIKKRMYALKHTGATDYLKDNPGAANIAWLQAQMGHGSIAETDTYIKKRTFTKLDEKKATIRKY